MTEPKSRQPESLEQRLAALRLDQAPRRDLWPGIAARLEPRHTEPRSQGLSPRVRGWLPIGAALAAGYVGASLFPLPWAPGTRPSAADIAPAPVQLLSTMQPALSQLPPKTRAVVEVELAVLEQDRLSLDEALAADPDNALLQELREIAQDRAIAVVERMNRLTRPELPEDVEI